MAPRKRQSAAVATVPNKKQATTESTIFEHEPFAGDGDFGGLPFVILFGDDYQLPSCGKGAFDAIHNTITDKMISLGASTFVKCGKHVMNLKGNKRLTSIHCC